MDNFCSRWSQKIAKIQEVPKENNYLINGGGGASKLDSINLVNSAKLRKTSKFNKKNYEQI